VLIFLKGAVIVFFHWLAQQLERDVRIVDAAAGVFMLLDTAALALATAAADGGASADHAATAISRS
jgi:hypothetical protein